MRRLKILAIAPAVAAVLAGTALSTAPAHATAIRADSGSKQKVLTIGTTGSIDSLSPFLAERALPTAIHRYIYDFLTNYDAADDHPIGGMASSWTTSADKLTWTYTIRSGMKWSDGQPATAKDIAWTYHLMMTNPDAATANGNFVANFKSVTAPSDTTLVIALSKPQATMLALDIPIVPEHIWQSHVADIGKFNNDTSFPIVGNGPFVLTAYQKDQSITLTANKNYWRGAPKFDEVVFRFYKDADAEVEALRKGEIDLVSGLTPAQYDSLKSDKDITLNNGQGKRFYSLAINPGATTVSGQSFGDGNPALKNQQVRQAIMDAINPKTLVSKTLGGYGDVGTGYVPSIYSTYHWSADSGSAYSYDPQKANTLLDEAGYKKGADGMRTTPDGKPLSLRIIGESNRPDDVQNATFVSEWLKAVGIATSTSIMDQSKLGDIETAGNYDLAFDSWIVNPDPDFVLSIQTCADRPTSPGGSFGGDDFICDPTYDQMYAAQISEYDQGKRADDVKQMEQRLYQDAYINVLYYPNVLEAYRNTTIGSIQKQPQPNGILYGQDGYWSWWSATPAGDSKSSNTGAAVGIGIGVVVILAAGVWFLLSRRRRGTAEERE